MVSQVGLNTSYNMALPSFTSNNGMQSPNESIFSGYPQLQANNYSNDLLMSGIDFSQFVGAVPVLQQQTVPAQNTGVQEQEQQNSSSEPKQSNWGKILGVVGGALTPLVPKVVQWFKGGKFTDLFKKKELYTSSALLAVTGLGIGMLIDSCFGSKKSQSTQAAQSAQTSQQQQEIIRNFVTQ